MKKIIASSRLFLIFGILVFTFFSCSQNESFSNEDIVDEKKSEKRFGRGDCDGDDNVIDLEDVGVNISWSNNCTTATITLSFCCGCAFTPGANPCSLAAGEVELQVEIAPLTYEYPTQYIPGYSLLPGRCHSVVFVLDDLQHGVAYPTQLTFNGESVLLDYNQNSVCN